MAPDNNHQTREARVRSVLVALALCLMAFVHPADALACGPYRVTFYELGSLYYKDSNGKYVGYDKDVVNEIARRTGCRFEGVLDSRVRTWAHMADGTLDMTVSGIATPDRQVYAEFIPYVMGRYFLIVSKDLATRVSSARDFEADPTLRLAVVKATKSGDAIDRWVDAMRTAGRVDEYADAEVAVRIFAHGRADAFISQPALWGPLLARNGLEDKVRKIDVAPNETAVGGLVLARKRVAPADVERMRHALDAMNRDGTLEKIYTRYVGPDIARQMVPPLSHP